MELICDMTDYIHRSKSCYATRLRLLLFFDTDQNLSLLYRYVCISVKLKKYSTSGGGYGDDRGAVVKL